MGENYHFLHLFVAFNIFITFKTALIGASDPQPPQELLRGFQASPNPDVPSFQTFLSDSTGNYSLGFLRVNSSGLALAVVHLASSETIWRANMTSLARWESPTQIIFNGSLIVSDTQMGRVLWSTYTNGDRVFLSNSSNLQIQTLDDFNSSLWQSFDFPSDTLVENQNFTNNMWLTSVNGLYSMQLGLNFMALYGEFQPGSYPGQIYWKHKALEAKGINPIYMVLTSDGFLGMYQNGSVLVDVQPFNSFRQPVSGVRRVRLESDGNLKGYFWSGSTWISDYRSISDQCELPSACGPYGLCKPGIGSCSCLNNQTVYSDSGGCSSPGNQDSSHDDLCSENETTTTAEILETIGVDLPFKELMSYVNVMSFNQCKISCLENCTCWGAVYSNTSGSGYCYMIEYPIQTLISVGDDSRLGYFKVREESARKKGKENVGLGVGVAILCLIVFVIGVGLGVWWYKFRNRKRKTGARRQIKVDGGGIGPYEDLEDDTLELSRR